MSTASLPAALFGVTGGSDHRGLRLKRRICWFQPVWSICQEVPKDDPSLFGFNLVATLHPVWSNPENLWDWMLRTNGPQLFEQNDHSLWDTLLVRPRRGIRRRTPSGGSRGPLRRKVGAVGSPRNPKRCWTLPTGEDDF